MKDEDRGRIWAPTTAPRGLFMVLSLKFGLSSSIHELRRLGAMTLWIVSGGMRGGHGQSDGPKSEPINEILRVPGIPTFFCDDFYVHGDPVQIGRARSPSHRPAAMYSEFPAQMKLLYFRASQAAIGPAKRAATHHAALEAASGGCGTG